MNLCMKCGERPARIHINTGPNAKHLWVCEECGPIPTPCLYPKQKWIRELRLAYTMTTRGLAQRLGISTAEMSGIELGRCPLSDEMRERIWSVFTNFEEDYS